MRAANALSKARAEAGFAPDIIVSDGPQPRAQAIGSYLLELLRERHVKELEVDLENPDKTLAVEGGPIRFRAIRVDSLHRRIVMPYILTHFGFIFVY